MSNELENETTHLAIPKSSVKNDMRMQSTLQKFFTSLKEATDWAEEEVKKDPTIRYQIFQLRTEIEGKVEVSRKDFMGASLV